MLADLLKPTDTEIRQLALRETDPKLASQFEPITKGPLVALAILVLTGLVAVPVIGFRLITRGVRNSEHRNQYQ